MMMRMNTVLQLDDIMVMSAGQSCHMSGKDLAERY